MRVRAHVRGWCMDISARVLSCSSTSNFCITKTSDLTPAPCVSVSPCGQGKKSVLSHDRRLCGPLTGSLATLFHNLSRNKKRAPRAMVVPTVFLCVMDASLPVVGTSTRRREGGYPDISGPLRPPGGVEVWRTSVLGMACVSVFSVCL